MMNIKMITDWVKQSMTEVEGMRQQECRKKTWWDCIKDDTESLGLSWEDAQCRNKLSKGIKGATD